MTDVIKALDLLVEYPHLQKYIKVFNGPHGFMYTTETETHERACKLQLDELLDPNGMHSGGSWGSLLRNIQAVLNGVLTREYVIEQAAEEEAHMNKMLAENAELRRVRAQAQAAAAQAEADQVESDQVEEAADSE